VKRKKLVLPRKEIQGFLFFLEVGSW
jgi:hypothetical protein